MTDMGGPYASGFLVVPDIVIVRVVLEIVIFRFRQIFRVGEFPKPLVDVPAFEAVLLASSPEETHERVGEPPFERA